MEYLVPIIVALIAGGVSLIGNILSNNNSNSKITNTIENKLAVGQAVTDTKIDNLTQEVRGLKDYAMEVPDIKQRLSACEDDIRDIKKGV